MLGAGAAVDADAGATGDLVDGGEKPLEFRRHRDGDRIDQGEDEVVGVLEGVADEVQALGGLAGTEVEVVRGAEQLAVHGVADLVIADEFVVHSCLLIKRIKQIAMIMVGQKRPKMIQKLRWSRVVNNYRQLTNNYYNGLFKSISTTNFINSDGQTQNCVVLLT